MRAAGPQPGEASRRPTCGSGGLGRGPCPGLARALQVRGSARGTGLRCLNRPPPGSSMGPASRGFSFNGFHLDLAGRGRGAIGHREQPGLGPPSSVWEAEPFCASLVRCQVRWPDGHRPKQERSVCSGLADGPRLALFCCF